MHSGPTYETVTDAEARRILARASALDASLASGLTSTTLRAIALEAGIAPEAIERAILEHREQAGWRAKPRGVLRRLSALITTPVATLLSPRSLLDAIARNAVALGIGVALSWGAIELARRLGLTFDGARLPFLPEALSLFLAAGVAERLRARVATVVLLGIGGALAMRFVGMMVTDSRALVGAGAAIALLGSGVLGVVLGVALRQRGRTMTTEDHHATAGTETAEGSVSDDGPSRVRTMNPPMAAALSR